MSRTLTRVLCVATGVGAMALISPIGALADGPSIQINSATLIAKGVEVDVGVAFTCPAGDSIGGFTSTGVNASVQQAVSKTQQAFGSASAPQPSTCTGSPQTALVQILANTSGPPFRTGPAVVQANLTACDASFNCTSSSTGPTTVRIGK